MYEEEIHFWKLLLKLSETVLTYLTSDTVTPISIGSAARTDVWTKFEEGRSRRSPHLQTDRLTDQHVQSNAPSSLKVGIIIRYPLEMLDLYHTL